MRGCYACKKKTKKKTTHRKCTHADERESERERLAGQL